MIARPENRPPVPFVGLRPFEFHEAALFYGRGEHIVEMIRTLRKCHFLAVIGCSGSGKSSLVRAGLLPAIADGFMDEGEPGSDWRFVIMRPGLDPYENLLRELLPILDQDESIDPHVADFRRQTLRGGPRGLVQAVADSLLPERTRLVVLVDQFEEIFRFLDRGGPRQAHNGRSIADQRNAALAFVDLLLATAAEGDRRVYVVLTMRSEYLGECEAFLGLSAAIAGSQFLTPRMTREQIQDIIERPLAAAGGRIDPAVVTSLLNSLGTAQDQLPRVEHVLRRMWDRACETREKQTELSQLVSLTLADYHAVGRFESALDQHAEMLYDELGSEPGSGKPSEKQRVAEWLFRSLTDRNSQGALVRRLTSIGEVASVGGVSQETVVEIVEQYRRPGCHFLVATPVEPLNGATTLDISHESLLRQWKRLGEWSAAEADAAVKLQRLVQDAQNWRDGKRGSLQEPELGLFQKWRKETVPSRQWAARYVKLGEFELADEYLREGVRNKKIRRVMFACTIGALVLLTAFSLYQWYRAKVKEWEAQHQVAMTQLKSAEIEIDHGDLASAILFYGQACEATPNDDPFKGSGRSLLASWCFHLRRPFIHEGQVFCVAFSPDGQTVLTGDDKTARLWDAQTSKPIGPLLPHENRVASVAFSPDGWTVLTGSWDKTVRLWDAKTGQPKGPPLTHQAEVTSVAFSPDGQTVLTGSWDKTAILWDVNTRQAKGPLLTHPDAVESVAFSPDGQTVLTGSRDNKARLWDASTGQFKGPPLTHQAAVESVAFSRDGQTVLTGSDDRTARLWDVNTRQAKGPPLTHQDWVTSVAFSPDGQTVLTGSLDKAARLWDVNTGQPKGPLLTHQAGVESVAFSPDGQTVLTGGDDRTARLWDVNTRQAKGPLLTHRASVESVAFSPDGQTVLTGSRDNAARLWDMKTGQAKGPPLTHDAAVWSVAFSPDGQSVLTGSSDKTARLWYVKTGQPKGPPLGHPDAVRSVAFSPDGQAVLTGCWDNKARLWDATTGQPKGPSLTHQAEVTSVAFSPDGQMVLTGSRDTTARLWDVNTGQPKGPSLSHQAEVTSLAFSPDGVTVLTGCRDKTARLWDVKTGQPNGPSFSHPGAVWSVAFSPDGRTVLTGCDDTTVRLWDVNTGQPKGPPLTHPDVVKSVAFSPDGQSVLTGSLDKSARLWDVVPPAADDPERLRLSVEVRTGFFLDATGIREKLTPAQWLERRTRLEKLGGSCDVRSWDDVSEKEKRELRTPPNRR